MSVGTVEKLIPSEPPFEPERVDLEELIQRERAYAMGALALVRGFRV